MNRIEHGGLATVVPHVRRDDLAPRDDDNTVDIGFDRHRLKGVEPGHALTVAVEGHGLVFVDHDRRLFDARVEPGVQEPSGRGLFLGEPVADDERSGQRLNRPGLFGQAVTLELSVQLVAIGDTRDRGGESTLHGLDGALGIGLLVAVRRQAKPGIEGVMTGERGVAGMEFTLPSPQDRGGDGPGIIPPDFTRHAAEELEGRNHAREDRLGAFGGQSDDEGAVRVGPGGDEERDWGSSLGEVDVDVTEVGFEASAGRMSQGDEGFATPSSVLEQVALDLGVTAAIALLVAEPPEHLHGSVALLGRGVLVSGEDLVDARLKRPEHRSGSLVGLGVGTRLGLFEDLANLGSGVMKRARDLSDGHTIASGASDRSVIVHRKHILTSARGWVP